MKKLVYLFLLVVLLTGCSSTAKDPICPTCEQVQVTKVVEVTREIEVTRLVIEVTKEPTEAVEPASNILWPTTTDEGNLIIQKILSALNAAGLQTVDIVVYTEVTDLNTLLGRPHKYIAKASWRDPSIAAQGEASVDNGGSIEVFLTTSNLQTRYDYLDTLSASSLLTEYHYQNTPAVLRLSRIYVPSLAKQIADIFLAISFVK
jgi:hypothetical protein